MSTEETACPVASLKWPENLRERFCSKSLMLWSLSLWPGAEVWSLSLKAGASGPARGIQSK